jgi:DNA-binding transcriptional ArsR family regulator
MNSQRVMRGHSQPAEAPQLTLSFEPALPERWSSLREFIAHRVQVQERPAKSIAADMDMAPSTLSRKLSPGEHDAQRFTLDDLEKYMQATSDYSAIEYLASKYLQSDEARQARAIARVEALATDLDRALKDLRGRG